MVGFHKTQSAVRSLFQVGPTMTLPPGIVFLRGNLPRLLGPTLFLTLLRSISKKYFAAKIPLPGWLQNLLLIASVPGFFVLRVYWNWYKTLREARIAGAVLPPTIPSKWPGGIDHLRSMFSNERTNYVGERFVFDLLVCFGFELTSLCIKRNSLLCTPRSSDTRTISVYCLRIESFHQSRSTSR